MLNEKLIFSVLKFNNRCQIFHIKRIVRENEKKVNGGCNVKDESSPKNISSLA